MATVIVKTNAKWRHGLAQGLPNLGTQTPSKEEGEFECEEDKANHLVKHVPDFYIKDDPETDPKFRPIEEIQEKSETDQLNELNKRPQEQTSIAGELLEALENFTRKELEEQCKPFPHEEWKGFTNKTQLIGYLKSKLA